ncbi:MAG: DUF1778 domain-containing protein [Bryobacteraceae bacterium]
MAGKRKCSAGKGVVVRLLRGVPRQYNRSRGRSMAISSRGQSKNRRFQLRATPSEEVLIKLAAARQGLDITDFIIRAARERAEETIAGQTQFVLNGQQWKAFMEALDRPARGKPRLRKLFAEKHVAKRRS